jgi:hypothetical protein
MSHTSVCVRVGLAPGALAERDACHAAPNASLVVNPLPPPFGLVLLALANTMPRTFLTRHYYSDAQMVGAKKHSQHEVFLKTALTVGSYLEYCLWACLTKCIYYKSTFSLFARPLCFAGARGCV